MTSEPNGRGLEEESPPPVLIPTFSWDFACFSSPSHINISCSFAVDRKPFLRERNLRYT
uniref:Uncharacterized protein n=1 Tax=Anguilla anguilla TaxID=7936 RepID=A0A0E9UMT9_ANGAN